MHSTVDNGNGRSGWTQVEMTGRSALVGGVAEWSFSGGVLVFGGPSFGGMLGFGLKTEIINDILSLELPARFIIGGSNPLDTTHFYPRLIASIPINESVEFNLSATRYYYAQGNGMLDPVGYAAGFAFGKQGEMIVRPEFGVLIDYFDDYPTYQFGVSFTPPVSKNAPSTGLGANPDLR